MILNRLKKLNRKMVSLQENKQSVEIQEKNLQLDQEFQNLGNETLAAYNTVKEIEKEFDIDFDYYFDGKTLRNDLVELLIDIYRKTNNINYDEEYINIRNRKLNNIESELSVVWADVYKGTNDILGLLKIISRFFKDQDKLRKNQNILIESEDLSYLIRHANNPEQSAVKTYKQALDYIQNQIDLIDCDDEVRAFLKKVQMHKVTIDDLSDNILDWIRKHELGKYFAVVMYSDLASLKK